MTDDDGLTDPGQPTTNIAARAAQDAPLGDDAVVERRLRRQAVEPDAGAAPPDALPDPGQDSRQGR